ncbi:MAG: hypothetical protein IPI49_05695 [Myxococcales bacterium]|nr:hypothetical protein [Myxococcales bacterium]
MEPDELISLLVCLLDKERPLVTRAVTQAAPGPGASSATGSAGAEDAEDSEGDDEDGEDDDDEADGEGDSDSEDGDSDSEDGDSDSDAAAKPGAQSVETLRRRCAEALEQRGAHQDALTVLAPLVNFTGHEHSPLLPCLCKRCLGQAGRAVEVQGVSFHRTFVVSGTRVLHFWLADELGADRAEVKRAVGEALRVRLHRKRRKVAS